MADVIEAAPGAGIRRVTALMPEQHDKSTRSALELKVPYLENIKPYENKI